MDTTLCLFALLTIGLRPRTVNEVGKESSRGGSFTTTRKTYFSTLGILSSSASNAARSTVRPRRSSIEENPRFSECCSSGKVHISAERDPLILLRTCLTSQERRYWIFRSKIRAYNSLLSMASVKANWVSLGPGNSNFNPTMTMYGRIYHDMGALQQLQGSRPGQMQR